MHAWKGNQPNLHIRYNLEDCKETCEGTWGWSLSYYVFFIREAQVYCIIHDFLYSPITYLMNTLLVCKHHSLTPLQRGNIFLGFIRPYSCTPPPLLKLALNFQQHPHASERGVGLFPCCRARDKTSDPRNTASKNSKSSSSLVTNKIIRNEVPRKQKQRRQKENTKKNKKTCIWFFRCLLTWCEFVTLKLRLGYRHFTLADIRKRCCPQSNTYTYPRTRLETR